MKIKREMPFILFGIIFCGIFVFFGLRKKYDLERQHEVTIGTIEDCENGGKGHGGSYFFNYAYTVKGTKYNESTLYSNSELSFNVAQSYFTGKSFPVVYYPRDPSNSIIMITPKVFKRFNYPFPDNLSWVLPFLKEK